MPSLNIEYIFVWVYQALTGTHVDISQAPFYGMVLLQAIAVVGVVVSVVLLIMTVYVRIRTLQVEHAGFHALESLQHGHEHGGHEPHPAEPKNPRWEALSQLASSPNESDWRRAITEADIMLGLLLAEHGYTGQSVGEQLKMANPLQMTTLDIAWEAHRMRNTLAHLGEAFPLTERDARATLDQYRRVFEEFDYI